MIKLLLKGTYNVEYFIKIGHGTKEHRSLHRIVILSPCHNLVFTRLKVKRTRPKRIVVHPILIEKYCAMLSDTSEKIVILHRPPGYAFFDETPQIIVVPSKTSFTGLPRGTKSFFMKQHSLFPKSSFRGNRLDWKFADGKDGGKSICKVGLNYGHFRWPCIRSGPEFNLHPGIQIGRSTRKCTRIFKQQGLFIRIFFGRSNVQRPLHTGRQNILKALFKSGFQIRMDAQPASFLQFLKTVFPLLFAWFFFWTFFSAKTQEITINHDINVFGKSFNQSPTFGKRRAAFENQMSAPFRKRKKLPQRPGYPKVLLDARRR